MDWEFWVCFEKKTRLIELEGKQTLPWRSPVPSLVIP